VLIRHGPPFDAATLRFFNSRPDGNIRDLRAQVTLATAIPESVCKQINLGYRDPRSIRKEDFANREAEGVLLVPRRAKYSST